MAGLDHPLRAADRPEVGVVAEATDVDYGVVQSLQDWALANASHPATQEMTAEEIAVASPRKKQFDFPKRDSTEFHLLTDAVKRLADTDS